MEDKHFYILETVYRMGRVGATELRNAVVDNIKLYGILGKEYEIACTTLIRGEYLAIIGEGGKQLIIPTDKGKRKYRAELWRRRKASAVVWLSVASAVVSAICAILAFYLNQPDPHAATKEEMQQVRRHADSLYNEALKLHRPR